MAARSVLKAGGFEHGGGSSMEQLVADVLDGANGQPNQVADEGDPFGLARAGTDHPFTDGRAEGFIDLGFDRDGDRLHPRWRARANTSHWLSRRPPGKATLCSGIAKSSLASGPSIAATSGGRPCGASQERAAAIAE